MNPLVKLVATKKRKKVFHKCHGLLHKVCDGDGSVLLDFFFVFADRAGEFRPKKIRPGSHGTVNVKKLTKSKEKLKKARKN